MIQEIKLHNQVSSSLKATKTSDMTSIFNVPLSLQDQYIPNESLFEGLCT